MFELKAKNSVLNAFLAMVLGALPLGLTAALVPAFAQEELAEDVLTEEDSEPSEASASKLYDEAVIAGQLRATGEACMGGTLPEVAETLAEALTLDPAYRARAKRERVFRGEVMNTVIVQLAMGADTSTRQGLARLLHKTTFYGPAHGIFPDSAIVRFRPNGRVEMRILEIDEESDDMYGYVRVPARWRMNSDLTITLIRGQRQVTYVLHPENGQLSVVSTNDDPAVNPEDLFEDQLYNYPSECEA